jgi:hypothetical protein
MTRRPASVFGGPTIGDPPETATNQPTSCRLGDGTVVAEGSFRELIAPESYARAKAVIVLQLLAAPTANQPSGVRLTELSGGQAPFASDQLSPTWTVTATISPQGGTPV